MKIFGQVLDIENEPLSLANISLVSGENAKIIGEQSDLDGNFSLENDLIEPNSEIKISYIGFVPKTFKASELQGKKVKLIEDNIEIEEVVVKSILKPKSKANTKVDSKKEQFVQHLSKHRFIYGGIGALAGIALLVIGFKKMKK